MGENPSVLLSWIGVAQYKAVDHSRNPSFVKMPFKEKGLCDRPACLFHILILTPTRRVPILLESTAVVAPPSGARTQKGVCFIKWNGNVKCLYLDSLDSLECLCTVSD